MYRNRPVAISDLTIIVILTIMLDIAVFAMVDFQVMQHQTYQLPEEQEAYNVYIFWVSATMLMFGIAEAVLIIVIFRFSPIRFILSGTVLLSTIIVIFSGLEDIIFFAIQGGLPADNVNWKWMWQARVWGFWNSTEQAMWTIFWLGAVLPIVLFVSIKIMNTYKVKMTTLRQEV